MILQLKHQQSDFVLIDVKSEYDDNGDGRRRRRVTRRRMQSESDMVVNNTNISNKCEPTIFTIYFSNAAYVKTDSGIFKHYPQSAYYDEIEERFLSDGCYVLNSTNNSVTYACRH